MLLEGVRPAWALTFRPRGEGQRAYGVLPSILLRARGGFSGRVSGTSVTFGLHGTSLSNFSSRAKACPRATDLLTAEGLILSSPYPS